MNETLLFLFSLAGAVLSKRDVPSLPENIDWNLILTIAEKHNIASVIAYGIHQGGYVLAPEVQGKFKQYLYTHLMITENQTKEIEKILGLFEEHHIDYMPLKGMEIRNIYPSPDMRRMADADVLIKTKDFPLFDSVMRENGYIFQCESNHEYVYQKPPFIRIELHKMLIPSYNDDMYAYYQDGWSIAKRHGDTSRHSLSTEDHYVYLMTHLAKHYRDGGIGIKSVMDLWLYKKTYSMDAEYVTRQLEALNLLTFSKYIDCLMKVWFDGEPANELINSMTKFILYGGEYGSFTNKTRVAAIRDAEDGDFKKAEKQKYFRLIFPKYKDLKGGYPYLEKMPFLLPVCWVHRLWKGLFHRQNVKKIKRRAETITEDSLQAYYSHIQKVGLDIYNGRKHL